MTATIEAKPADRLDQLRQMLIKESDRRNKLVEFIATSPARERELIAEHLETSATLPGAVGPVEDLRRKRREAEKALPIVEASLDVLNTAVLEEEAKQRAIVLAELRIEVTGYQDRIRDAWRAGGKSMIEFNDAYIALVDVLREFHEFREANINRVSGNGDEQDRWRYAEANFVVEFAPGDLAQFFLDLYEVMCDPAGLGYRRDLYPEARPYDEHDQLRKLVPDLREAEGRLTLSRSDRVRYSKQRR